RRIRRGERRPPRRRARPRRSFNAATANSPWRTTAELAAARRLYKALQCGHGEFAVENTSAATTSPRSPSRFNAATANSPWRTTLKMNRGSERILLQCGHGEFAVENAPGEKFSVRVWGWLQCGHGEFAVENGGRAGGAGLHLLASMRPRRIRRGEP